MTISSLTLLGPGLSAIKIVTGAPLIRVAGGDPGGRSVKTHDSNKELTVHVSSVTRVEVVETLLGGSKRGRKPTTTAEPQLFHLCL